jgi:hypothetical protein
MALWRSPLPVPLHCLFDSGGIQTWIEVPPQFELIKPTGTPSAYDDHAWPRLGLANKSMGAPPAWQEPVEPAARGVVEPRVQQYRAL